MTRATRLTELATWIVRDGSLRVEDVTQRFAVSASTARRDLDALADQQFVQRTRGGAQIASGSGDLPLRYAVVRREAQKQAIASAAAALVEPDTVVGFNGGTTTTAVAHELGIRMASEHPDRFEVLTVVTNAVNIAAELVVRPQLRVVVTAGVARPWSYELTGPLADAIFPQIDIGTLFLGINALDVQRGVFTQHDGEAAINAALVKAARRVVVVADSSKLSARAFVRICGLCDVDELVTDSGADPWICEATRAAGVTVTLV
ncbi:MAG: DeoR/GlpR family DNA-binding transcription regulator [Ornithinimicrobium sp.]